MGRQSLDVHRTGQRALLAALVLFAVCGCSPESARDPASADASATSWEALSSKGVFSVGITANRDRIPIGAFHEWEIAVRNRQGRGVHPALIRIDGGMPEHGHGLPTAPRITDHLGGGRYRIEGMRFNMAGAWVLEFDITAGAERDSVSFDINLAF